MKIIWVRLAEVHVDLGQLDTGKEYEASDALAAAWIAQGAARSAEAPSKKRHKTEEE